MFQYSTPLVTIFAKSCFLTITSPLSRSPSPVGSAPPSCAHSKGLLRDSCRSPLVLGSVCCSCSSFCSLWLALPLAENAFNQNRGKQGKNVSNALRSQQECTGTAEEGNLQRAKRTLTCRRCMSMAHYCHAGHTQTPINCNNRASCARTPHTTGKQNREKACHAKQKQNGGQETGKDVGISPGRLQLTRRRSTLQRRLRRGYGCSRPGRRRGK